MYGSFRSILACLLLLAAVDNAFADGATTPLPNGGLPGGTVQTIGGGTGANTAAGARQNLGVGNYAVPGDYDPQCLGQTTQAQVSAHTAHDCSVTGIGAALSIPPINGIQPNVYLQAGGYYLASASLSVTNGQTFQCDGHGNTTIFVDQYFNASANGVLTLSGRGAQSGGPTVRGCLSKFTQPADITTTASSGASSGAASIVVPTISGHGYTATTGYIVYDSTNAAIVNQSTITSITGTGPYTVGLSNNVTTTGVSMGDTIGFAPSRSQYAALSAGCGNGIGCRYPPFIYSINANFVAIDDVWTIGAWDGINLTNSGGGGNQIRNSKIEALDAALNIDNQSDFTQVSHVECNQTFGSFSIYGPYADGGTLCQEIGRVDGFTDTAVVSFLSSDLITSNASNSEDDWVWTGRVIDGGALTVTGGPNLHLNGSIEGSGFGVSQLSATPLFSVAAGRVFADGFDLFTTTPSTVSAAPVSITGGTVKFSSDYLENDGTAAPVVSVTGGTFNAVGTSFINHNATGSTPALVKQTGASGIVQLIADVWGGVGSGTPIALTIATDSEFNIVVANTFNVFGFSAPGTTGTYGPNGTSSGVTSEGPIVFSNVGPPTLVSGSLGISGSSTAPTMSADQEAALYPSGGDGVVTQGKGSTNDWTARNSSATDVFKIPAGTTTVALNTTTYASCTALTTNSSSVIGCTSSALRFKEPQSWLSASDALDKIDTILRPASWVYKQEYQDRFGAGEQVGLYADDVEKMDKRCVVYEPAPRDRFDHGPAKLKDYKDRCVIAYLVGAVKELHKELENKKNKGAKWH